MKELLEDGFKAARERYAGATQLAFLLVALLLALHLTTVTHYLERERALRDARSEAETALRLQNLAKEIKDSADNLEQERRMRTDALLQAFITGLKGDFRAVDAAVSSASGGKFGQRVASDPELPSQLTSPPSPSPAAPSPPPVLPPGPPPALAPVQLPLRAPMGIDTTETAILPPFPPELLGKIKSIQDIRSLREELAPWIKTNVLAPRLDKLRENWKNEVWPNLERDATTLLAAASQGSKLSLRSAELTLKFVKLNDVIQNLLDTGRKLDFREPADPTWWQSEGGKMASGVAIGDASAKALGTGVMEQAAEKCADVAAAAKGHADSLSKDTELARDSLDKAFEEQKKRADALAQPLTFLAVDLAMVAESFPLVLGAGLGVVFFWPGWRRRELAQAWAALSRVDPEWREVFNVLGFTPKRSPELLLGLIAAFMWLVIASWQLNVAGIVPLARVGKVAGMGLVFLGLAIAWRLREEMRVEAIIRAVAAARD